MATTSERGRATGGTAGTRRARPAEEVRLAAYRRRGVLTGLATGALLLVVMLGTVAVATSRGATPRHPTALWLLVVAVPLVAAAFTAFLPRWLLRTPQVSALVASADRRDLARVASLLRKGEPVSDDDRRVAQAVVDSTAHQHRRWRVPLIGVVVLICTAAVLLRQWSTGVYAVLMLLVVAGTLSSQRRLLVNAAAQGIGPRLG